MNYSHITGGMYVLMWLLFRKNNENKIKTVSNLDS